MDEARQCPTCRSSDLTGAFLTKEREYVRCCNCGLIFLKRINPEEERIAYETGAYQLLHAHHRLGLRELIFATGLREITRIKRPGRLLDVGCGDGLFLNLARKEGWETFGVELSAKACEYANGTLGLNVTCGELFDAHFSDSFFDVVTLYNVLDHLPFPIEQLVEINRILKSGGLLVIRVPNAIFHVSLIRLMRCLEPYLVFHLHCFTPKTIRYLLAKTGYIQIRVRNSVLTSFDVYSVSPLWGDIGMQLVKRGLYLAAEVVSRLSAHALITGPSLKVLAIKDREVGRGLRGGSSHRRAAGQSGLESTE